MNAWNSNQLKVDQPFRVTAGGARFMVVTIGAGTGSGADYKLQSSYDGGATWRDAPGVSAISNAAPGNTKFHLGATELLFGLARVTGTDKTAVVYIHQED